MPEYYRNAWYAQLKQKADELQAEIDRKWNFLLMMEETTQKKAQEQA